MLAQARAVLIVPDLYKAGFVVGGQFGNGVLLVRGKPTAISSYPAFYTLSGGSLGLQIGAEDVSIVFLIMTDKGSTRCMQQQVQVRRRDAGGHRRGRRRRGRAEHHQHGGRYPAPMRWARSAFMAACRWRAR